MFSMVQHPYYDYIQDNLQLDQEHMCIHKCIPKFKVTKIIVKNGTVLVILVKEVGLWQKVIVIEYKIYKKDLPAVLSY